MDFEALGAWFSWVLVPLDHVFWFPRPVSRDMRGACQVAVLTLMIRATRGRSIDRDDLIIWVAILAIQKLWGPLICDDFRVGSIASRNRLRLASLFGAILVVLGNQNRCPNSILEPFFSMSFSKAFWHRNLVDFWRLKTRKIAIFFWKNNDFHKISFFDTDPKNKAFSFHFRKPKRRKFQ